MTTNEVLSELNARTKPYIKVMPQSTYSRTIRDIKNGNCKQKTMQDFFAKFGYTQNEVTWKKQ
jgi:hypothetical protein